MLRVMLIKKFSGMTTCGVFDPLAKMPKMPEVGDEFVVTEFVPHRGKDFYVLTLAGSRGGFDPANFATLPGLSADEINELEKEAIIR